MDEILNHRSNEIAIAKRNGWICTINGASKRVITTKGWELKVQLKDSSSNWIPLRGIKEYNPIKVAEYAVCTVPISNEPAFTW